jgi:hypothetical protein
MRYVTKYGTAREVTDDNILLPKKEDALFLSDNKARLDTQAPT